MAHAIIGFRCCLRPERMSRWIALAMPPFGQRGIGTPPVSQAQDWTGAKLYTHGVLGQHCWSGYASREGTYRVGRERLYPTVIP